MKMSRMVFYCLLVGAMNCLGQTRQEAFQLDLQSHGWHVDQGVLNGSSLPQTMDFSDDGSLWVAFPVEASKALQTRDQSSAGYKGKILHLAQTGSVLAECGTDALQWEYLRLFAQRTEGFTLDAADKIITYDIHCKEMAQYPTGMRIGTAFSPDRSLIYTRSRDNNIHVLRNGNLQVLKAFDLPEGVKWKPVLFGDESVIFPITVQTKSCYQTQLTRMDVKTGKNEPWTTLECTRYNLLGDDHIIYTSLKGDSPLEIIGKDGVSTAAYKPPKDAYIDRAVLDRRYPVVSPQSLRVVEELIEAKGRHPSLDMSGKFVGRDIVLLDMHTGTALLTVKVPLSTQVYSYALSRDGKRLAVLLDSQLAVYQVP
jgi:hypothetical protein